MLTRLISESVEKVYPHHEHIVGDCLCNIYGDTARNFIFYNSGEREKTMYKFLFILKFRMLYNYFNLKENVIHTDWFKTFDKHDDLPNFSIPFEMNMNFSKVNYFGNLKKSVCIEDGKFKLYIPFNKLDFKVTRINYSSQYMNKSEFEVYSYTVDGKHYTYELTTVFKNLINQIKSVIKFLSNLTNINDVDLNKIDEILATVNPDKSQCINFLSTILQDKNVVQSRVKKDIKFLVDVQASNEPYEMIKQHLFTSVQPRVV